MSIPITAACMRTIRKCGGLDQYLLGEKPARIKELGHFGWKLRWRVMNSKAIRKRHQEERRKLGLALHKRPCPVFDKAWETDENLREEVRIEQEKRWQELKEKDERFRRHAKTQFRRKDGEKQHEIAQVVPDFDTQAFESLLPASPS